MPLLKVRISLISIEIYSSASICIIYKYLREAVISKTLSRKAKFNKLEDGYLFA